MTTVNTDIITDLNKTAQSKAGSKNDNSAAGIQDRFLTLLMAQLKAQDPMNPMDNAQITSQMAQISTVTGMENMNQTMNMLLQSQFANQSMMAATLIGKQVMTDGNGLVLGEGGKGAGAVELAGPADKVKVTVSDKDGNVVRELSIDKPKLGINHFEWDGKDGNGEALPAGEYSFKVEASNAGVAVKSTALAFQQVNGVTWEQGIPMLMLANGKTTSLAEIVQIV
ncbi:flagellar hook assembly protein FlgD [Crenobacter caeni]|uniref:Basal-body rod modification protein FlgD n=1 Tax=Crenobacter caeni TaxID=2705474 RepID=A0A6B2KSC9_9NEIS|nr:flagellar hook assembly protein FlgD [Crenobacter caeni]NDV13034.1 flagellar hook assembly protein FlgD [Crenobacter caeni]